MTDRKEQRTASYGFKKLAVQWQIEVFPVMQDKSYFVSSSVLAESFVQLSRKLLRAHLQTAEACTQNQAYKRANAPTK